MCPHPAAEASGPDPPARLLMRQGRADQLPHAPRHGAHLAAGAQPTQVSHRQYKEPFCLVISEVVDYRFNRTFFVKYFYQLIQEQFHLPVHEEGKCGCESTNNLGSLHSKRINIDICVVVFRYI